jgi:hypothetical protein
MIKSFVTHMQENSKLYEFKIRLAFECDDNLFKRIEAALGAYDLKEITKPKSLPIQEDAINFPQLGPVEIVIIEAKTGYPAIPEMIHALLIERVGLDQSSFVVHTLAQDADRTPQMGIYEREDALLDTELEDYQLEEDVYGNEFISDFLDSIETREYELAADRTDDATTTNDLAPGTDSPVGSQQNKIPTPGDM